MIKTMTANQKMAELFQRNKSTISRHIRNVFESGKQQKPDSSVAFFATTAADDKTIMWHTTTPIIINAGPASWSIPSVGFRFISGLHKYCASI